MKVKIGENVHDAEIEPIMIILTEQDRENIKNMADGCTKYCVWPRGWGKNTIKKWMDDDRAEVGNTASIKVGK